MGETCLPDLSERFSGYRRRSLYSLVRSDVQRWGSLGEAATKLGFYAALMYRISHALSRRRLLLPARLLQLFSHVVTGAEISHKAEIGPSLAILHPTGIHIGPCVRIGCNATICECSSVVTNQYRREDAPVVGDDLWMGAGCRIIGPVIVGDRVFGAPNSVVTKSVASDMMALGVPARIMPREFLSLVKDRPEPPSVPPC